MKQNLWVLGDNIDTDRIIAGKYTKTLDESIFKKHIFEDLDGIDPSKIKIGDVLVAGENFGCGSSREQAAIALKSLGLDCIIAKSFARIFFRNGINVGLPLLALENHTIDESSELTIQFKKGLVEDSIQNKIYQTQSLPGFLIEIMEAGGLAPFLKIHKNYDMWSKDVT